MAYFFTAGTGTASGKATSLAEGTRVYNLKGSYRGHFSRKSPQSLTPQSFNANRFREQAPCGGLANHLAAFAEGPIPLSESFLP
jgi:hypothetical protein